MIYTITQPSGIDVQIQKYQTWLYDLLRTKWNISDDLSYDFYGKVYRNKTQAGYIPESFVSSLNPDNTQYKEIIFDQTNNAALSFF